MTAQPAPATVEAALARAIRRLERTLDERLPALIRGKDADYGRSVRVATRKLRVILGVCGAPILGRKALRGLNMDLRWLGRLLGQPRDLVLVRASLPAAPSPWLSRAFQLAHGAALRQAGLGLRGPHLARLRLRLAQIESRLDVTAPSPLEAAAARRALRLFDRALTCGGAVDGAQAILAAHEFRKAIRKLRYCCDLLKAHKQAPWRQALAAEIRELQDWLGQFQDLATRAAMLSQLVERQRLGGREIACLHSAEQWIAADQARLHAALQRFPARYAALVAAVQSAGVRPALVALARPCKAPVDTSGLIGCGG